jgi:hypothetical protein
MILTALKDLTDFYLLPPSILPDNPKGMETCAFSPGG